MSTSTSPISGWRQLFYGAGLGLTRDPYLKVSDNNMWMNVGRSQFHLPTGNPPVLRGHTGLVIEGREALLDRLATVRPKLDGTRFDFHEHNDYVEAMCPWGNRVRCYEPDADRFGRVALGMPYVEFDVPVGTATGIARFYREMIDVPADGGKRRRHRGARHRRQMAATAVPRDRPAAAGIRRASHPDLCGQFLRAA